MKTITTDHLEPGQTLSIHDLCYLIYEGFGQWRVEEFAHRVLSKETPAVVWATCEPCETRAPFLDEACLICGTTEQA